MLRNLVYYSLVAFVAIFAVSYLDEFFVYVGDTVYLKSVYGELKGRVSQARGGRRIYSFTSVPYAKPPLGELRFEPPVPLGKWEDEVLDATRPPKLCIQVDSLWKKMAGQEDCLHLQVYSPDVSPLDGKLPVMVYFHGGHWMYGGTNIYGPEYLLEKGDIVLVAVNYRLNSLGFLSTHDDVVPGNMGLKDQVAALKWIQRAIRDFGGNPEEVTIVGGSAGASSVSYHIVSPMSKGLFHRGISQSGTSLCPWSSPTRNPKKQAQRLAEKVNCTVEASKSSAELVKCLRTKSAEEIVAVHHEITNVFHEIDAIFGPTVEKTDASSNKADGSVFLPDSPTALYKSGKFHHVPWIAGVTSEEGCFRSSLILPHEDKLTELNEKWSEVAPKTFLLYNDDPSLSEKVRKFYFGKGQETTKQSSSANEIKGNKPEKRQQIGWDDLEGLTNAYSDRYFFGCVRDAAIFHSKHAPVHLYYYTYKPDITFGYLQETITGKIPTQLEIILGFLKFFLYRDVFKWDMNDYGVCHTDELQYLFQLNPLLRIDENSPHYEFSRQLVNLWTSFVKTGKPDAFLGVPWTPLKFDDAKNTTVTPLQYLRIGKVPAIIDEPFTRRLKFWEELNLVAN